MSPATQRAECVCADCAGLCPVCYQLVEREAAEATMRQWLREFGNTPDPRAPAPSLLRLVR